MNVSISLKISSFLISAVAFVTLIGPYAADWNETHIYNPRWPPHAKFHNGQTMLLGTLLSISALWYIWKPVTINKIKISNLLTAILLSSLYWISQSLSILYPETGFTDPEFGEIPKFIGIPSQLLFDLPLLITLLITAYLVIKTASRLPEVEPDIRLNHI